MRSEPADPKRIGSAAGGASLGVALAAFLGEHPLWLLLVAAIVVGLAQQALP
jgi:hypothetical protein